MPRHARVVLPHTAHPIIQRGHNRQVVFAHDDDYAYYLETLQAWQAHYGVKVYAFCLMTNHVHLLRETPWLDHDSCYQALGASALQRAQRYQAFVMAAIPEDEWRLIRQAIQRGQRTGTVRFVEEVAVKIGKRLARRGQGRPRKTAGDQYICLPCGVKKARRLCRKQGRNRIRS